MHQFCGPIDLESYARQTRAAKPPAGSAQSNVAELTERIEKLEAEVAELKILLS
jgi:uncharacterized protein YceH (UPF0502 family)